MGWTDERIETLKSLWLEGLSASQIARQLGGVTRNAVIGKVHYLGLSGRASPSQPSPVSFKPPRARPAEPAPIILRRPTASIPRQQRPVSFSKAQEPPQLPSQPIVERVEERGQATVLTLGRHMCKWPIGEPSTEDFTFCCRRAADERPYCVEHVKLAYAPVQGSRKARGNELARSLRRYI